MQIPLFPVVILMILSSCRFLRARKFDLEKAKVMIIAAEQWRKDFGVDDVIKYALISLSYAFLVLICSRYVGTLISRRELKSTNITPNSTTRQTRSVWCSHHVLGSTPDRFLYQEGRPIYVERLGQLDVKALYAITTPERQLQRLVYEYEKSLTERLPACTKAVGHPVETFCTILDLQNVSLTNFYRVKDFVMAAASVGQDRYPETMGKFYIINAPWAFSTVWTFIKPWLDEVTVAKIDIIGSSYKDKLLAQIEPENLPKEFGGTCECDGLCSLSDAGPWSPKKEH